MAAPRVGGGGIEASAVTLSYGGGSSESKTRNYPQASKEITILCHRETPFYGTPRDPPVQPRLGLSTPRHRPDPPSTTSPRRPELRPAGPEQLPDAIHVATPTLPGQDLLHPDALPDQSNSSPAAQISQMATTACFVIVSKNDIPIYEAEVGSAPKKEDLAYHHQFILHAALDVVQDLAWTTSAMFLKSVDRFNDLVVSVYVTAGHTRFMLLHDSRSEDGIKGFFQEVHELYIKIFLNPLYLPGSRIASSHFDTKVRALARKYL